MGRSTMAKLGYIMKDKNISHKTKFFKLTETLVFPIVTYGSESWTMKKQKRKSIDVFELRCWHRVLRIPWTVKRTDKSVVEEIKPKMVLDSTIQGQGLRYFSHIIKKHNSIKKNIMLSKSEGKRRGGMQRSRWLDRVMEVMG